MHSNKPTGEKALWHSLPYQALVFTALVTCVPLPLWLTAYFSQQAGTGLEEVCVLLLAIYYFPPMLLGVWMPFGVLLLERDQFLLWPNWLGVFWCAFVYGVVAIAPAVFYHWWVWRRVTKERSGR